MTVYDNIAFSLRLKKVPEDVIYAKVTNAAEILGITQYLMRKPRALSGGQRQRVAIGRAMVRDSKVFLMDEPLSNLDAKLRNQMRAEIILLRQKLDTTFIYVTHDQTEAMTLGDRIVIMKDGYIMQVGSPMEVFEKPSNLFVAEFIGAPKMNVLKTSLVKEGNRYFVTPCGAKIEVTGEKAKLLADKGVKGGEILLGARPEHITLAPNAMNGQAIPCKLEVKEMMGSELHLHVVTEDETRWIVRVPTIDLSQEQRDHLEKNDAELYITFEGKAMHFFDPETEKNLIYGE
jgi:multiple sugar transport system ATP-binding protein